MNPDLFWAMKGSGSNFGIVTSFKFKTFEAPSQVTKFDINLNWGSGQQIAQGWGAMQDWVLAGGMPKEMNMRVFGSGGQTQIQGLYHGNSNNLKTAIQPLLSKIGGSLASAQQYDWMGAFSYYTYANGNVDLTHPYSTVSLLPAEFGVFDSEVLMLVPTRRRPFTPRVWSLPRCRPLP